MYERPPYYNPRSTSRRFSVLNPEERQASLPYKDEELPLEAQLERQKFEEEMLKNSQEYENQVNSAGYGAKEELEKDKKDAELRRILSGIGEAGAEMASSAGEQKGDSIPVFRDPAAIIPGDMGQRSSLARRYMQALRNSGSFKR